MWAGSERDFLIHVIAVSHVLYVTINALSNLDKAHTLKIDLIYYIECDIILTNPNPK